MNTKSSKSKTPAVDNTDASVNAAFGRWLSKWDIKTMGEKPTADQLRLSLATGAKPGTGAAIVRATLFRKDGATKPQRDAVMLALGLGPCENQGAFGDARRTQWTDGHQNVEPGKWRNVTVGTAVIGLTLSGRSHWFAKVVTPATGRAPSTSKTTTTAPPKTKAVKAPAKKAAKAPAKPTSGKTQPAAVTPTPAPVAPVSAQPKAA